MSGVRLQPLTRRKVASLGEEGQVWLEELPTVLDELAEQWALTWGRPLPGGSASYVVAAVDAAGRDRAVKVGVPDPEPPDEARTLGAARGRGYAVLHGHDPARRALLLERLGPSLQQSPMAPERTLDLLLDTLREAWTLPLAVAPEVLPGQDRASLLRRMVLDLDARLGGACEDAVLAQAVEYADRRTADRDTGQVVVHGDPHPANALRVGVPREGAASGYCFVDPVGVRCDPAYDVGVVLRDWTGRLAEGGRPVLEGYCDRLAARSGLDRQRIWEWAFLERVSTGLSTTGFGATRIGAAFLGSARLLLDRP